MMNTFDATTETELIKLYCHKVKPSFAAAVQRQLRYACSVFRKGNPNRSILNTTNSTMWVSDWKKNHEQTAGTQAQHVSVLRNWWNWLFERQVIADNVLIYVCLKDLVEGREPGITLPTDLHRAVILYQKHLPPLAAESYRGHRMALRYYVRFVSRQDVVPADNLEEACVQERIQEWIMDQAQKSGLESTTRYVRILGHFTAFLFAQGWLSCDPFKNLLDQYPLRGVLGLVRALQSSDAEVELQHLAKSPKFQSCISRYMSDFLHWKRTMGCKYKSYENTLADFDRFLIREKYQHSYLTKELLNRYTLSCSRLHSSALRLYLGLVRQFCIYLKRFETDTFVPDRYWSRVHTSVFIPHVLSPDVFIKILDAIDVLCQTSKFPMRRETFRMYLRLLYSCGLRPSEGLHLSVQDVDLETGLLTIRDTKFYKSRLVPVAPSLAVELRHYASYRDKTLLISRGSCAAFFSTKQGTSYSLSHMEDTFKSAVRQANIQTPHRLRSPRLYDLRHSFAVLRLLLWYRQGINVQNKLPLLSTYLGHTSLVSTQVYLTATAELLEEANQRFETYAGELIPTQEGSHHECN